MRLTEFDIARGFTVLIMPGVHVVLMYGSIATQAAWPGKLFGFLAEGPGAPLFMFLMGVCFSFSSRVSRRAVFIRAIQLAALGYLLNFLKFIPLQLLHRLPDSFMNDYNISAGSKGSYELLTTGDILQFAAIALVIIQFISSFKHRYVIALACVCIVTAISPLSTGLAPHYFIDLFTGEHGLIFFPVFPWLAYPLSGYCMTCLLTRFDAFVISRNIGLGLLIFCLCISVYMHVSLSGNFYKSPPVDTIYHIAVILLWLYGCHTIVRLTTPGGFSTLLCWLSRNILPFYCIQWILVCWLLPVAGYKALPITQTMAWIACITGLSMAILYSPNLIKESFNAYNHQRR